MAKLTKRQRDALKAQGLWKPVSITPRSESGVEAFCRLAAEANKEPVPCVPEHWTLHEDSDFHFTLDHEKVGDAANDFLKSGDFFEYTEDILLPDDDVATSDGAFFDAMLLNLGNRVIETSGLSEASNSHQLPVVPVPGNLGKYLESVGEFDNGVTTATFSDAQSLAKTLLWCSQQCVDSESALEAIARMWLPNSPNDGHAKMVIADRLKKYLDGHGVFVGVDVLVKSMFSGLIPKLVQEGVDKLPAEHQDLVPIFFRTLKDAPSFHKFFGSHVMRGLLNELNLQWKNPSPSHLCFNKSFRDLTIAAEKRWSKRRVPNQLLFSCQGYTNQQGSEAQLVLPGKEENECFVPGHSVSLDTIALAYTYHLHSVVSGKEMSLATFQFNPHMRAEDFELCDMDVSLLYKRDSLILSGFSTDEEMEF